MRVSVTGDAAIRRRVSPRVHYTMKRERGDKRLECGWQLGPLIEVCLSTLRDESKRNSSAAQPDSFAGAKEGKASVRSAPLGMTDLGTLFEGLQIQGTGERQANEAAEGDDFGRVSRGSNQFFGAMNQFYKYDKRGVGAYNLAHSKPEVGAQHCLTSDEHFEVSTVVRGLS
jgi:hypothetical protein